MRPGVSCLLEHHIMSEKSKLDQVLEDILAGRFKADPIIEKTYGLRGNEAVEIMQNLILRQAQGLFGMELIHPQGFRKGRCLLRIPRDNRIVLATVTKTFNAFVSASFYFGKTYGKFPVGDWEVDHSLLRTPGAGYFLLNTMQLKFNHEIDLAIVLRDEDDALAFQSRLALIQRNIAQFFSEVFQNCLDRVAGKNPRGYANR